MYRKAVRLRALLRCASVLACSAHVAPAGEGGETAWLLYQHFVSYSFFVLRHGPSGLAQNAPRPFCGRRWIPDRDVYEQKELAKFARSLSQRFQEGTLPLSRLPHPVLAVAHPLLGAHRWSRKPRPQPQTFSKLVFLIYFS